MPRLNVLSATEQVAAFLKKELARGAWSGVMPGGDKLAKELGVGSDTIEAALKQLEVAGFLINQGRRRGRLIVPQPRLRNTFENRLKVAILLSEPASRKLDYMIELRHELQIAGYDAYFAEDSLVDLGMDLKRITRMVKKTKADSWVVMSGSHELMDWFNKQKLTVFALFGRRRGFAMAGVGPDKPSAIAAATRELIRLGHSRIVLLSRPRWRRPIPGASERAFLNELVLHGIIPSVYHLPDWEPSIESYYERLEALFHITPPTALIIDEVGLFVAAQQFLAERTLRVPQDVSMICADTHPAFEWCRNTIAHIEWDNRPVVRRVLRWMEHVSQGKPDLRQTLTPAKFVSGGTIGPARTE